MKNEVLKDIDTLICELEKTDNSTLKYFSEMKIELVQANTREKEKELLRILSKSSRIMDAGGFNLVQQNAWNKMFDTIMDCLSKT